MSLRSCTTVALLLGFLLLGFAPEARSQSSREAEQPPRCTDLSGKIPLPCPPADELGTNAGIGVDESPLASTDENINGARVVPSTGRSVAPTPSFQPTAAATPPKPNGASAPTPAAAEDDPRAAIGFYPKEAPEPEPVTSDVKVAAPASRVARSSELSLARNLVQDQKQIWTSPFRLRLDDVQWLAPLLGAGAVAIFSDTDIQRHLPASATLQTRSKSFSNYGVAAFAGMTGAAWLLGRTTHNDHLSETGILSGEAALDSFALTYAIKSITRRDRPYQGNGMGTFFASGDSFPSEHAAAAWAMASVIAHQYPGPLTALFAYGGAAAISAARVTGRQHFASDALVGSALGYFVGRHVYKAHHSREDMERYGTFVRAPSPETPRSPKNMGSAFVPLDSWVYSAFDRLAALGYIHTAFAGLRPWTRLECLRLLDEADSNIESGTADRDGAFSLLRGLQAEFAFDAENVAGGRNLSAELESVYARVTGISGKPLNDSYHFGQTIINDYGRPYQQGFNMVTGLSARAEAGPLAFYFRGEYQHAPSAPAYPLDVRQAIAATDAIPLQPAIPFAAHNDFQLLDTYVALNIRNNQISFGRQSIWWGPGQGGALMFSDNALPFYSLRWTHVSPSKLPSILGLLGPVRTDFFVGKLEGHHFPAAPYISGQKISFKPTENLELGFSKITVFAGGGAPLTWRNFYKATFDFGQGSAAPSADAPSIDPGDRRSGFDFSYRVPGLRNWLTLYSDALADDEPSPIASPRRSPFNPGVYLSRVPGIPKLDFRAEAAYTDVVAAGSAGGLFIYWNTNYRDSHTNAGNIMGHWIGREGRGLQLSSTYWLSRQNTIQFGYRNARVAKDFLQGGSLDDFSARASFSLSPDLRLSGFLQYEHWNFPLLSASQQHDVSASVQVTFRPGARIR